MKYWGYAWREPYSPRHHITHSLLNPSTLGCTKSRAFPSGMHPTTHIPFGNATMRKVLTLSKKASDTETTQTTREGGSTGKC